MSPAEIGCLRAASRPVGAAHVTPHNFPLVSSASQIEADLRAAQRRTVVVLGNESTGIPPDSLETLDVAVEILMEGTGSSLNVAVAGSLVIYKLAGLI